MKTHRKKTSLIAFIALVLVILGIVLFFLNQNKTLKKEVVVSWDVKIIKGEIYKVYTSGQEELLVGTSDIKDEVIEKFLLVELSPDRSKICFVGQTMVPQWLYYANSDGSEITKIGIGKNCAWSHDSQKVAYNNHTTDVSPVAVFVYDLALKKTTNYTSGAQRENLFRAYETPVWSSDDYQITSKYTVLSMDGTGTTDEGTSVIDLESGKISEGI